MSLPKAEDYLQEYYTNVDIENKFLMDRAHKFFSSGIADNKTVLEVGGGPTIYQLLSAGLFVDSIYFTEYDINNLSEVIKWINGDSNFSWLPFSAYVAELSGNVYSPEYIERTLKEKIKLVTYCDLSSTSAFVLTGKHKFDIVSAHFCIEVAAFLNCNSYEDVVRIIDQKIKVGGNILISAIIGGKYKVGNKFFNCIDVAEQDVINALSNYDVEVEVLDSLEEHNYGKIISIIGTKLSEV